MDFIDYFLSDPTRLLAIIGGSGGLMYWWDRYTGRARIAVRVSAVDLRGIELEIENRSDKKNSLAAFFSIVGFDSFGRRKQYTVAIPESERALPPFVPRTIRATFDQERAFLRSPAGLRFVDVIVPAARGRPARLRLPSLRDPRPMAAPIFAARALVFRTARGILTHRAEREFNALAKNLDSSDPTLFTRPVLSE